MAEKTNVDVEMTAEGDGVFRVLDSVALKVTEIQRKIDLIGRSSEMSGEKFEKAVSSALGELNAAMGQMAIIEKSLTANARDVRQVNQARQLATATKNASQFAGTLNNANNASLALTARLNDIDKKMASIALKGGLAPSKLLADRKKFEDLDKTLKGLDRQFTTLSNKARQTGGDFTRSFAAIEQARAGLFTALKDGRRTNFTGPVNQITDLQANLGREIATELQARKRAAAERIALEQAVEKETAQIERRKTSEVRRGLNAIDVDRQASARREERLGEQQVAMANRLQKAREKERDAQRLTLRDRIAVSKEVARLEAKQLSTVQQIEQARKVSQDKVARAQGMLSSPRSISREELAQATAVLQIERARIGELNSQQRILEGHARAKQLSLNAQKEIVRAEARQLTSVNEIRNAQERSRARLEAAVARLDVARGKEARDLEKIIAIEKARTVELEKQLKLRTPKPDSPAPVEEGGMFRPGTLSGAFAGTARYGFAAASIYGFVSAVQQGIQFAIEFEDALANLQAIASATDTQMERVAANILQVGRNSKSSIIELTDAATTLAQAGFTSTELEQSLDGIAKLSAASGASIKESVDLVTSAVGAFGLQASETDRIADILVSALNRSKLSVEQVGLAVQYVGSTARENNVSFEELTAAAGALANAGIRSGSTIGTGLRQLLVDLKTPTEDLTDQLKLLGLTQADVDVKTKGLAQVLTTLRDAGFGASQAYGALEVRAAASFLTLSNNLDLMRDLQVAQQQQGAAAEAQERAMDSLSAQWQRFKNIVADNNTNEITDFFSDMLRGINDSIVSSRELEKQMGEVAQKQKNDIELANQRADAYFAEGEYLNGLSESFKALGLEIDYTISRKDSWIQRTSDAGASAADLETRVADLNEELAAQSQKIQSVESSIGDLLTKQSTYKNGEAGAKELELVVASLGARFEGLSAQLAGNAMSFDNVIAAMRRYRNEAQDTMQVMLQQQQATLALQGTKQLSQLQTDFGRLRNTSDSGIRDLANKAYNTSDTALRSSYLADLQKRLDQGERKGTLSRSDITLGREFVQSFANYRANRTNQRLIGKQYERGVELTSQRGRRYRDDIENLNSNISRLSGLSDAERRSTAQRTEKDAASRISEIDKSLANPRARLTAIERAEMQDRRAQYVSIQNQARAALAPSKAEEKAAKAAERDAARKKREAERDARRFNRGELKVSQTALKTAELDLRDALENIKGTDDFSVLSDGFQNVEEALAEWKEKRLDVMADEIKTGQLTGAQADNLNREVNNQIEAKFREVRREYGDALLKFLNNQIEAADRAYQRYLTPFQAQADIASARTASLDREALRGRVPDFVRNEQERRANLAQESLDRATIVANEEKILSYTDAMIDLNRAIELVQKSGSKEAAEMLNGQSFQNLAGEITVLANVINGTATATGKFSQEDLANLRRALEEVRQKIEDTKNSNLALKASFQGEDLLPTTFSDGLRRAVENYRVVNGLNNSFEDTVIGGLDQTISNVHGVWNQFMSDMMTKPGQALSNFQNFAQGVIRALQQMAAQALATQIFGMILKLAGGALAPSVSNFDVALPGPTVTAPLTPLFNGGIVGYSDGGLVNHGVPNRDSVLTALARGEYVVRKKAVDSVGRGFLDEINKNGAKAMPSTAIAMPAPARQETNVYVVKDEPPPQMGPNDVLAVVANDILKDGQTKRLIKHISQGG